MSKLLNEVRQSFTVVALQNNTEDEIENILDTSRLFKELGYQIQ